MAENYTRINLRVPDKLHDRLLAYCDQVCMPKATIAALALADFLTRKETEAEATKMINHNLLEMFKDPHKAAMLASEFEAAGLISDDSSGQQIDIEDV